MADIFCFFPAAVACFGLGFFPAASAALRACCLRTGAALLPASGAPVSRSMLRALASANVVAAAASSASRIGGRRWRGSNDVFLAVCR